MEEAEKEADSVCGVMPSSIMLQEYYVLLQFHSTLQNIMNESPLESHEEFINETIGMTCIPTESVLLFPVCREAEISG